MPLFDQPKQPKRVGFTGTQDGMNKYQQITLRNFLRGLRKKGYTWFHHGDCVGADEQAAGIAKALGYKLHCHPPTNESKRAFVPYDACEEPLPYLVRNKKIVEAVSYMTATPKQFEEELRSGTWSTIRHSRKLDTPLEIVYPASTE